VTLILEDSKKIILKFEGKTFIFLIRD